jgi:hypothetical protein
MMVLKGSLELASQPLALGRADFGGVVKMALGLPGPGGKRLTQREQMALGLAYHFDKDVPLPAALAAKPTHGFFESAHKHAALGLEKASGMGQCIGDVIDHLEDFFWAL